MPLRCRFQSVALGAALLYLTLYLPLTAMVYAPYWYRLNCHWHTRCERIGYVRVEQATAELTAFFRHQGELNRRWTPKERHHLAQVREIYDGLFRGALAAAVVLALTFERRRAARLALINIAVVLALLAVLPIFKPFWREVFHPLLFDDMTWRNTRLDLSYYFMPRQLFKYSLALLVALAALLNLAVWFGLRGRRL